MRVRVATGAEAFVLVPDNGGVALCQRAEGDHWSNRELAITTRCLYYSPVIYLAAYCEGISYLLDEYGHVFTVDGSAPPPLIMTRLRVQDELSLLYFNPFPLSPMGSYLLESHGQILSWCRCSSV
ncbi:hypothetical protein BAE44_0010327 [Dichanthelium oligosanthes]|uniref:Uncharacterized protein n=1 Tax=Dichanthelium oligosanthes TaxID=888268 RepID=A0A1E5VUA7_9POAL|nr:hypothetical protein BAE44_0010327 [Dichanthelium oligosanthes]